MRTVFTKKKKSYVFTNLWRSATIPTPKTTFSDPTSASELVAEQATTCTPAQRTARFIQAKTCSFARSLSDSLTLSQHTLMSWFIQRMRSSLCEEELRVDKSLLQTRTQTPYNTGAAKEEAKHRSSLYSIYVVLSFLLHFQSLTSLGGVVFLLSVTIKCMTHTQP